jgi:hypothetical protein
MPDFQPTPPAQSGEIQQSQVHKTEEGVYLFDDQAALKLIVDDIARCDQFMEQEQWAGDWLDADILVQSPRTGNAGAITTRTRVPRFTLSNHLSTIVPKAMQGLFYESPYFQLKPGPNADPDIVEAKKQVAHAQLKDMNFPEEVERGFEQMALLGTCIFMWGWLDDTKKVPHYEAEGKKEEIKGAFSTKKVHTAASLKRKKTWITKEVHRPFFKQIDIRHVLVDTSLAVGDITCAKHVTLRDYNTFSDLNKLRGQEGYTLPSEAELLSLFFPPKRESADPPNNTETLPANLRAWIQHATPRNMESSSDPLHHTIVRYQRWDNEKVIEILQCNGRSLLIRNECNPFGKIPFYSCNWRNLPACFYGQGLGKLIGMDQRVEEATLNAALSILGYAVKPSYIRKRGLNAPTQQIRQSLGGIIEVDDDVDKAFRIMELPKVPPEAWQVIGISQASAQETSGANQQVSLGSGASGVKTTGMRSGTGAALVGQAAASRLDGPVERFIRQVFVPWLYQLDELNNERLPAMTLAEILGKEISQEVAESVDHVEYANTVLDYDVLAGAHLGAVAKMLQAMPFYMQFLNSPALMQKMTEEGYEIDAVDLVKQFSDLTGTRYTGIVKKMAPEKQAQAQANSPAAIQQKQAQAASALEDKKFQNEQKIEEQRQLGKAAGEQNRVLLEHAMAQEINPEAGLQPPEQVA